MQLGKKYRKDIELYGDVFYNCDLIMQQRQKILKEKEKERNQRISKSKKLRCTWELMRVCKEFLQEWEGNWTEGTEKTRTRQEEMKRKEFERKERCKIIDKRKKERKRA